MIQYMGVTKIAEDQSKTAAALKALHAQSYFCFYFINAILQIFSPNN